MLIEFSTCQKLAEIVHGAGFRRVYHVGAHVGEEAAAYAAAGVGHVVWFEADTDLIPTLSGNLAGFPMDSKVVPLALSDSNGRLSFNITNNRQSSSFLKFGTHEQSYPMITVTEVREVSVFRLDSIAAIDPPLLPWTDFDFLNIDTQGSELAILRGAGALLSNPALKGIYLEINRAEVYSGNPLVEEIDNFLLELDFHRIITSWTEAGWGDAFYLRARSN